jgi:hypothetical protein
MIDWKDPRDRLERSKGSTGKIQGIDWKDPRDRPVKIHGIDWKDPRDQ